MEQTQPDTGGAAAQEAGEKEKLFYVNRNGNLTCRFAAVSSETMTGSLSDGSHTLTWGLCGADKVSAVRDGETLYKNPPENPRALGLWDEWRLILQVLVKAVEF